MSAWCCSRASTSAASCSTPTPNRTRAASLLASPKAALVLPLEEPAPPGPRPRAGDAGERGRGRRLFREPPARQPHRRLGEPAVAPAREPLRAREGGRALRRQIRHRRGAAPALLDRLPHRARSRSSSGRTGRSACTTGSLFTREGEGWREGEALSRKRSDGRGAARSRRVDPAPSLAADRVRRHSSREIDRHAVLAPTSNAATRHAAHRREPRHRARDRQALLGGGLAGDHLLAPRLSGELPLGDGPGGSPPGRPRRAPTTRCAPSPRSKERLAARGRRAARPRQQRRHLAEGRGRRAGSRAIDTALRGLAARLPGELLRADHAGARPAATS